MPGLQQLIIVAAGGALGACARYAAQHFPLSDGSKFYITALVNLAGCLLIGVAWAIINHVGAPRWVSLLAITGFLGGFTTFSAFSLETMQLMQTGRWAEAAGYVALSVAGGIICCGAGIWITNRIMQ